MSKKENTHILWGIINIDCDCAFTKSKFTAILVVPDEMWILFVSRILLRKPISKIGTILDTYECFGTKNEVYFWKNAKLFAKTTSIFNPGKNRVTKILGTFVLPVLHVHATFLGWKIWKLHENLNWKITKLF